MNMKNNEIKLKLSSFECAKISAKRSKLISKTQFDNFFDMSFDEILKFLEENGFRNVVDSSFLQFKGFYLIERILNSYLSDVYSDIFASASNANKELFEAFYLKYQTYNLMALVKCRISNEKDFGSFLIGDKKKKSKFLKAFEMSNIEDSLIYISKILKLNSSEILLAYSKGIYYLENYLYKNYYEKLNLISFIYNNIDEINLNKFNKTSIDLINSRTYIKFKLENELLEINSEDILVFKDSFIFGGYINLKKFDEMDSSSNQDIIKKLLFKFQDLDSDLEETVSPIIFDKKIYIHNLNASNIFKYSKFGSPFYILKYLFDLESQCSRLRILLKAKYLNLDIVEIKGLL